MLALVCTVLAVCVGAATSQLHFLVQFSAEAKPTYFHLEKQDNPVQVMRSFCYNVINSNLQQCTQLVTHIVTLFDDFYGQETRWAGYEGDILTMGSSTHTKDVVEEWGRKSYLVNLQPLDAGEFSAIVQIPQFRTNIQSDIDQFCIVHHVPGMGCRALSFELTNFVTSLYFREGGTTIKNIVSNMRFEHEIEWAYFPLTWQDSAGQLTRDFFDTDIQFVVLRACKFCALHKLRRAQCKLFVDFADRQLAAYYGSTYVGFLWVFQYVLNALEAIALAPLPPLPGVAAFVEIGTSNFDTVTQLVDEGEGLVGYAVEPSAHYLSSLPARPNVTRVNCAIVTESSVRSKGASDNQAHTSSGSGSGSGSDSAESTEPQFVDFYHIPEEVIDRLGLFYYLKGCNAIGDYHPSHVASGMQHHVVVEKVPAHTITQFLLKYDIHRIQLLKIDAEGYDLQILDELYNHIVNKRLPIVHVDRIVFETNVPEEEQFLKELMAKYGRLGYRMVLGGENTIMEKIISQ